MILRSLSWESRPPPRIFTKPLAASARGAFAFYASSESTQAPATASSIRARHGLSSHCSTPRHSRGARSDAGTSDPACAFLSLSPFRAVRLCPEFFAHCVAVMPVKHGFVSAAQAPILNRYLGSCSYTVVCPTFAQPYSAIGQHQH